MEKFNNIEVSGIGNVYIRDGEGDIRVEAPDNIKEYITTNISNGKLTVKIDKPWYKFLIGFDPSEINICISVNEAEKIKLNGALTAELYSISSQNLELNINGAADVRVLGGEINNLLIKVNGGSTNSLEELKVGRLNYISDGSGKTTIDGKARELRIELNGVSKVDAREFEVEEVEVAINGAGSVDVNCTESIKGKINGAGRIKYRGKGQVVESILNGVGSIKRII